MKSKTILSFLLALIIVFNMFPTFVSADDDTTPVTFQEGSGVTLQYTGTTESTLDGSSLPLYIVSIAKDANSLAATMNFTPDTDGNWRLPLDLITQSEMTCTVAENTLTINLSDSSYYYGPLSSSNYAFLVTDHVSTSDFAWDNIGAYYFIMLFDNSGLQFGDILAYLDGTEGTPDGTHNINLSTTNSSMDSVCADVNTNFSDGDSIFFSNSYYYGISNYTQVANTRPLEKIVINDMDVAIPPAEEEDDDTGIVPGVDLTIPGVCYGTVNISFSTDGYLLLGIDSILCTQDIDIDFVFQDTGEPEYTVTASSADTSQGSVTAAYNKNIDGGGSMWTLIATPAVGYYFDHWDYRTGSTGDYTTDTSGLASYTVTIYENREYIAYFSSSCLSLGEGFLMSNHSATYFVNPSYPNVGSDGTINIVSYLSYSASSVFMGEHAGFAIDYTLSGSAAAGTVISFYIYSGSGTSDTLLQSISGTLSEQSTDAPQTPAGDYTIFLNIGDMPDVSQLTVVAQLGDNDAISKTYEVSPGTPTDNDYIDVAISVPNPTLVHVLKTVNSFEVLEASLEQAYPTTWYIDVYGGFVNGFGTDPTGEKQGLMHVQVDGNDCWGWLSYLVNGYYCDIGCMQWIPSDGEAIAWGNTTGVGQISSSYTDPGFCWAIALLREYYTDDQLTADGVTTSTTVDELKQYFPDYAEAMTWELCSTITSVLDPVKTKIDAIGTVTKDSGDAISAAQAAFDGLPSTSFGSSGYYPYLFQTYEPYQTAYETLLAAEIEYAEIIDEIVSACDVNQDGSIDVQDMILLGNHFGEEGDAGWVVEDVNSDGNINVLDMILIGNHIGE